MPQAFLFDLNRCTGCEACGLACTIENELDWGTSWRRVETFNESRHPAAPVFHLSLACNHCAEAPCMSACPALAYSRDSTTGAVLLGSDRCIGCNYCSWVCPFEAPHYDASAGVMNKCTFCNDRLLEGRAPACVAACPTAALRHGELDDLPGTAGTSGFPETKIAPSIRFVPLHRVGTAVGRDTTPVPPVAAPAGSLASEWPLLVFTVVATGLVALFGASLLGGPALHSTGFLAAAVIAAVFSSMHLGRKLRAWRALLNLRGSWLSREIASYAAFVALAAVALLVVPGSAAAGWLAGLAGFACLYAIDRVYDATVRERMFHAHSGDTLPTALFLVGLLTGNAAATFAVGLLKLGLYVHRKAALRRRGREWRPGLSLTRVMLGFAVPVLLSVAPVGDRQAWLIGAIAAGELIDRYEFYRELVFVSPRRQVADELRRLLGRAA